MKIIRIGQRYRLKDWDKGRFAIAKEIKGSSVRLQFNCGYEKWNCNEWANIKNVEAI